MSSDIVTRMKFSGPVKVADLVRMLEATTAGCELSLEHRVDYHEDGSVMGEYFLLVLSEDQFDKLGGERVGT